MTLDTTMAYATNGARTVHSLVRLLKSPTDPPSAPGPSKIEIAYFAWSDPSFGVANKGEVIGEWILTVLGQARKIRRERDASSTSNPIADPRYWALLCGVLTTSPSSSARPIKTWLPPLLSRFQLESVVVELLVLHSPQVLVSARVALTVLWPLMEKKIGVDALGECLSAVLDACGDWERVDDDLGWISSVVVRSYRNSLASSGNKKKLYNSFLTTHLSSWLSAVCISSFPASSVSMKRLQDSIYAAGIDTLFSLEALKQPLDTSFSAFSSSTSPVSSLLLVLPKIFSSFLGALHRHRSALFASASTAINGKEEIRKWGMDFVGRYWALIWSFASLQEHCEVERWKSVINVFRIVETERLFVPCSIRATHTGATNSEYDGELALTEARDKTIEILETVDTSFKDSRGELAVLSIQLLCVLVQIEYDLVGSVLERILCALINIPLPLSHFVKIPTSKFLTHVLEYHTKTRTLHTYILTLLSAVAICRSSCLSMKSILPLAHHLPALARALHTSLTPTQTTALATAMLRAVENAWGTFNDVYQEETRTFKKQKVTKDMDMTRRETTLVPARARAFSYTGCIASTVLSNLPANTYTKGSEYSSEHLWGDVGKLGWTIIWDCLKEQIGNGTDHSMVKGEDKKRKHTVETSPHSARCAHIVASVSLRFLYDFRARVSSLLGDWDRLDEARVRILLDVAQDQASDPELVLEIIRTLLWHIWYEHHCKSKKKIETQPIFTMILGILTTCPLAESGWSGALTTLTRDSLGLAVLHVLTDRWIDVFDALASTEDLHGAISLLLTVPLDLPDEVIQYTPDAVHPQQDHAVITSRSILLNLLRNAQFWELHNIRAVLLSSVLTLTAPLSSYFFPATGFESPSPKITAPPTELTFACDMYRLLHYVPPEYFTRSVRVELVKRAMGGDIHICTEIEGAIRKRNNESSTRFQSESHTEGSSNGVSKWSRRLTFIRVFLQRMGLFLNIPSHTTSSAFINHLLLSSSRIPSPSKTLESVTINLIQSHLVGLLRSREPTAAASVSSVMSTLIAAKPFSRPCFEKTWTYTIVQSITLRLIERLTDDFDRASLSDQVTHVLKTLLESLERVLLPLARRSMEGFVAEPDQSLSSERIDVWCRTLSLARWLGINSPVASVLSGVELTTLTIRNQNFAKLDPNVCSSILRLLFEELWCLPDIPHYGHLDVLVSFYAVNGGDRGSDVQYVMDTVVAWASKKLSTDDLAYIFNILTEGIGGGGLQMDHYERLIRLGKIVLHDTTQGMLRVIQNFATRCLNLFAEREQIYGGSSHLKAQFLEFMARYCSDRPAAVRSVDLGSIWSVLNRTLSGSQEHDATTAFPIFHHIIVIIGALVRLRRDLIVHTLPHLSLVLRQLIMLTRRMRPQLGAKQSKIVTDAFPSWLSVSQPLSTDEARAFARLLASLTIKTVPRTHIHAHLPPTSTESQKAESLAKPFSKHATHVLVSYVDALNDPLCIINAEMKRELEPGLFALCEMVGEHSRDALMVSALDSSGKTILKSLWKEYEKQRYVGKG